MTTAAQYENQLIQVMGEVLKKDSLCIDVGCHEGAVLREMERLAPDAEHIAFEPLPHLFEVLRVKFPNSRIYNCALGSDSATKAFHHVKNDPAYSGLKRREYDIDNPDIELVDVEVRRLDDLINKHLDVSMIKLDVEGGEYHAALGAERTIRRCRPVIVFEASDRSTGHYGVTADMIFALFSEAFGLQLSTMANWLEKKSSFTKAEFLRSYSETYYFIAYP